MGAPARRVPRTVTVGQALSAVGLIRPTRRRGFCPACRLWDRGSNGRPAPEEISAAAVAALVFLALAAVAWALTIWRSGKAGVDMGMGMGSLGSFAAGWTVMMAAMMLPTALPLVFEFARRSEGRPLWRVATALLAMTYLSLWLAFGLACYAALRTFPIPHAHQLAVGGIALALAGLYGLTPIKASNEARCRELCSLHGPLPFSVVRSAMVAGARYGLSCLGCSAGLMVAMVIIGMSSLGWMVILAVMVLLYKLAPAPSLRRTRLLSGALMAMAITYVSLA